jgi:signal transduction histidine kinase/ActR/RegA family two-component response regulator
LRLACEATGFGSYDNDVNSDRAIWSPELYQMLRLPIDTPIKSDVLLNYIHPDDREDFERQFQEAIRSGGSEGYDHQFRVIIEGRTRWLRDIGHTFFIGEDERRRPVRVVGMVQDITPQKEYEVFLEHARRAAEAASQSRGEFLANMSHEIRTPMTAILGHVDILGEELSDPEHRNYLETIRRNGKFLLRIINDILDLSKIDADKLVIECDRVRLDQLLAEVRTLMDLRAEEKGLELSVEIEGMIPETIEIDAVRLRQILLNLLGNAIKFTHAGSVRLLVRFVGDSSQLQFDVIDTGIGIPQDLVDELFQPFSQADTTTTRNYGGTGLGLTICRRLARMLGGDITVESRVDIGSKFTLVVECRPEESVRFIQPDLTRCPPPERIAEQLRLTARILVVDDRRDIRFLLTRILQRAGAMIETADNGREAVEKVRELMHVDGGLDLVVIDMQMPEMDGYEATRTLRELGFDRPIVALTANAMHGDRERCVAAGCTEYISKPIDGSEMLRLVSRLVEKHI